MLKNENIICISSIDWDFIWQGHQEIMSTFAKNGNRVLFIENTGVRVPGIRDISRVKSRIKNWLKGVKGIRKEMENLYVYSPIALPFPYSRIARFFNRYLILPILERWMKAANFSNPVVLIFLPTPLSLDIVESLIKKLVIYYCIDNFSASSRSAKNIRKSERKLLEKVNLVFATSKELERYCSRYNNKVYNLPFAVNFNEFQRIRLQDIENLEELKNIRSPIIGYVGGIHKWIDKSLVKKLAKKNPDYSFVFIGPIQSDISSLSSLKNVYFLGKKEHDRLPIYIKCFDIGMIPYLITDYTRNVYPTKLNEYLALGKAVISTELPEIISFNKQFGNIVDIASDLEGFDMLIKKLLSENSSDLINRRIEIAKQNSWTFRIEDISRLIENEIEKKEKDVELEWKENLINFYNLARKKMLKAATFFILVYFLVFKTSFVWFLANPLKIVNFPKNVDAIVVFGGGVGETGNPGKSTVERARYATELYHKGYSDKIIFSSGYTYEYNDAENMRLFALSMNVPGEDIILEQQANSAYENVMFSKEILDKFRWGSILVVSSPYNMRRLQFVFKKQAKNIRVTYAPVKKSQFYDRTGGTTIGQIKAIIHEYLGIVYYWLKGYI